MVAVKKSVQWLELELTWDLIKGLFIEQMSPLLLSPTGLSLSLTYTETHIIT